MLRLIESRPQLTRSRGATLVSLVAHVTIVASVMIGTANARNTPIPAPDPRAVYLPMPTPSRPTAARQRPRRPIARPATPMTPSTPLTAPMEIPLELPPPADPRSGTPTIGQPPSDGASTVDGALCTTECPVDSSTSLYDADAVGRPVVPIGKARAPRYPEPLLRTRAEGTVVASFVVDTLGRVEPASIRAFTATHPLFEEAVRSAVLAMRFRPAELEGRRVRQLVEQRFVFRLTR